ncbi:MAG: hypothetical protein LC808_41365 [Actinobacteria bacterium]|nr:hypothetical protein [Actinomycetota bacterium]
MGELASLLGSKSGVVDRVQVAADPDGRWGARFHVQVGSLHIDRITKERVDIDLVGLVKVERRKIRCGL